MTTKISASNVNTATVATLTATQTLTNKTISAASNTLSNIPNSALTNSTVSGVALGSNLASLTASTGLSGGPFNGSAAITLAIDSTVATLTGTQTLTNKTISGATNTLSSIPNSALTNSSISGVALGSNLSSLTAGTGLSGGPFNGSAAVTLAIDSTVATLTGTQTLTNKTIGPASEAATITAAAPTATTNFDLATQAIQYYTSNATTNFTLNVRGSSSVTLNSLMAIGASMSLALAITVGTTGYYPSAFQIDGVSVTPKWLSGTIPAATNPSSITVYNLTIIKTAASTYTVLGTSAQFV